MEIIIPIVGVLAILALGCWGWIILSIRESKQVIKNEPLREIATLLGTKPTFWYLRASRNMLLKVLKKSVRKSTDYEKEVFLVRLEEHQRNALYAKKPKLSKEFGKIIDIVKTFKTSTS